MKKNYAIYPICLFVLMLIWMPACDPNAGSNVEVNIYVSSTGNNTNTGTKDSPLKSIQAGINSLKGKNGILAVRVAAGTYELNEQIAGFFRIRRRVVVINCGPSFGGRR